MSIQPAQSVDSTCFGRGGTSGGEKKERKEKNARRGACQLKKVRGFPCYTGVWFFLKEKKEKKEKKMAPKSAPKKMFFLGGALGGGCHPQGVFLSFFSFLSFLSERQCTHTFFRCDTCKPRPENIFLFFVFFRTQKMRNRFAKRAVRKVSYGARAPPNRMLSLFWARGGGRGDVRRGGASTSPRARTGPRSAKPPWRSVRIARVLESPAGEHGVAERRRVRAMHRRGWARLARCCGGGDAGCRARGDTSLPKRIAAKVPNGPARGDARLCGGAQRQARAGAHARARGQQTRKGAVVRKRGGPGALSILHLAPGVARYGFDRTQSSAAHQWVFYLFNGRDV